MKTNGSPPKFKNVEDIAVKIAEYFIFIKGEYHTEDDKTVTCIRPAEPPTITGLALYLGFESRQSIYDYEKRGKFSYTVKRARLTIESEYEKKLHGNNPTGPIFALKNFGWQDRHEHTGKDGESLIPAAKQVMIINGKAIEF